MNLYLLRHGIAVERGAPGYANDADRPLTSKGKRRLRQIAAAMAMMKIAPDLVLSSPYLRAKQTAEIAAKALEAGRRLEFSDDLTPAGDPKGLVGRLKELSSSKENVLLAGHEPYMSELISLLVSGKTGLRIDFKKGGLCKLTVISPRFGAACASLDWLLTPKQMILMTGSEED